MAALYDIKVTFTYEQIGSHLLVHLHAPKLLNHWMLLDLEELARKSGTSPEQILARLRKKSTQEN